MFYPLHQTSQETVNIKLSTIYYQCLWMERPRILTFSDTDWTMSDLDLPGRMSILLGIPIIGI